jgi:hypothetical protein
LRCECDGAVGDRVDRAVMFRVEGLLDDGTGEAIVAACVAGLHTGG